MTGSLDLIGISPKFLIKNKLTPQAGITPRRVRAAQCLCIWVTIKSIR
jgi:hypothetical protein